MRPKRLTLSLVLSALVLAQILGCYEYLGPDSMFRSSSLAFHPVPGWHIMQSVYAVDSSSFDLMFIAEKESQRIRSRLELDSILVFSTDTSSSGTELLGRFLVSRNSRLTDHRLILCQRDSVSQPWPRFLCTHEYEGRWLRLLTVGDTVLMKSYCEVRNRPAARPDTSLVLANFAALSLRSQSSENWRERGAVGRSIPERDSNPTYIDDPIETRDSMSVPSEGLDLQ